MEQSANTQFKVKWEKQKVLKSHVDEYVAQSNLGIHMKLKMSDLMEAFRLNDGGRRYKPVKMCCWKKNVVPD